MKRLWAICKSNPGLAIATAACVVIAGTGGILLTNPEINLDSIATCATALLTGICGAIGGGVVLYQQNQKIK